MGEIRLQNNAYTLAEPRHLFSATIFAFCARMLTWKSNGLHFYEFVGSVAYAGEGVALHADCGCYEFARM